MSENLSKLLLLSTSEFDIRVHNRKFRLSSRVKGGRTRNITRMLRFSLLLQSDWLLIVEDLRIEVGLNVVFDKASGHEDVDGEDGVKKLVCGWANDAGI